MIASLGGYQLLERLGEGGAGTVFRARSADGELVAVKLFRGGRALTAPQQRRFETEARALTRLSHPHIVGVRTWGLDGERAFLVMDLIRGESLEQRLTRAGPLPLVEAVRLTGQIAEAIEHAHRHGIIHRDLKPDNVILDAGGQPRLTDFGLAKDLEGSLSGATRTGDFLGTPGFWSPEQITGETQVDARADVYGLGGLLYALLTGKPPIEAESLTEFLIATAERRPEPPSRWRPEVDAELDAVVLRCLAKRPADRWPSAASLGQALEAWSPAGEPAAARRRPPRASSWAAALLVVAGGVGAVAIALRPVRPDLGTLPSPSPSTSETPTPTPDREALLGPARAAEVQGDHQAARAGLAALLTRDPDDLEALAWLSLLDVWEDEGQRATAGMRRVFELDPQGERLARIPGGEALLLRLLAMRAQLRMEQGELDAAEADLSRMILIDPQQAQAWAYRGQVAMERRDAASAIADFTRYLQLSPDDPQALELRGVAYSFERAWAKSYADFDRALTLAARPSPILFAGRGEAARNLGRLDQAADDFRAALQRSSPGMPGHQAWQQALDEVLTALGPEGQAAYEEGLALEQQGQIQQAVEKYGRAIQLNPSHVEARFRVAQMANSIEQYQAARELFDQNLELDPSHLESRAGRAIALHRLGELDLALADAEAVLAESTESKVRAVGYLIRGSIRDTRGEAENAVLDYTRGLQLDPGLPHAPTRRGLLLAARGEHERAIEDLTQGLARNPELLAVRVRLARARALAALGRIADARVDVEEALSRMPPDDPDRAVALRLRAELAR